MKRLILLSALLIFAYSYCQKSSHIISGIDLNENWYKPKLKNVYANLTQVEKYNIQFIKKVENRNLKDSSSSSWNGFD